MNKVVYVNGQYVPANEATISIFDRGFLFGDSVYEVIPVYNGKACFTKAHLARLESNLNSTNIKTPKIDWEHLFQELIHRNSGKDMQIYIQITRGSEGGRSHNIPKHIEPTVVAFTLNAQYPTYEQKQKGLSVELCDDVRWLRCNIKTTAMLANVMLNDGAVAKGADTAILVRDGHVTEGASSNIFVIGKDDIIRTPPLNNLCLPGITRQTAIELIKSMDWPILEEPILVERLFEAKEIWVTSTTKEIYPVTSVNQHQIGTGRAGTYWEKIEEKFHALVNSKCGI